MKKILGQESRRGDCSGIRSIKKKKKKKEKRREGDCTAGSHEEGLCPDAGGEYIRKPILP